MLWLLVAPSYRNTKRAELPKQEQGNIAAAAAVIAVTALSLHACTMLCNPGLPQVGQTQYHGSSHLLCGAQLLCQHPCGRARAARLQEHMAKYSSSSSSRMATSPSQR
jgi:hypothetical protein